MATSRYDIESIWNRIAACAGQEFRQVRGKPFTYTVKGNSLYLDTTNRGFSKGHLEHAIRLIPLKSVSQVQHLQAPSYIFAILTDPRIIGERSE